MGQDFDVKTLVLKRWDASQTKALFGVNGYCPGQFVSFQSHHFIDIISSGSESGLLGDYSNLCRSTSPHHECSNNLSDTHIVQRITLIGDSGTFWDSSTSVMYITLIQLSDSSRWEYDTIHASIQKYFSPADPSSTPASSATQWALYYSLDYCDFVLFTKNVSLKSLNDLLWKMALIGDEDFSTIRDTFTIYCFEKEFLQDAFHKIESCQKPLILAWDDTLSLAMNFSVRDYPAEQEFTDAMEKIDNGAIRFSVHRLQGRYDLNYTTEEITGTQALEIIYQINKIIGKDPTGQKQQSQDTLGVPGKKLPICSEYEIVLLSPPAERTPNIPNKETHCSDFDVYATKMVEKLYSLISARDPHGTASYIEYVEETLRSLHELAKNDFSEEFVLCVLPSLIALLRIIVQKQTFLINERDVSAKDKIHESCAKLQKSYFTAMNTLSLCTMHSERQFIHTPAFNANYFDIPPKLLAYYNAIVYNIAYQLKDKHLSQPSYHYVVIPDYRADIHVEPLNITYKEDTNSHLAIINLSEKFFYQPQKAIMLLAHEVGHYEGNRKRDFRANSIFYLVGITIFYHTPLSQCIADGKPYFAKDTLVSLFAQVFGNYLKEQFDIIHRSQNRGIDYLLSDITDFLSKYRYGLRFLESYTHRYNLVNRWIRMLTEAEQTESLNMEIVNTLSSISEKENSDYFRYLSRFPNCLGSCEVIARSIASHCGAMVVQKPIVLSIMEFCREIVELFAESYADWQMHDTLGAHFNIGAFQSMLAEAEYQESFVRKEERPILQKTNHVLRSIVMNRMCGISDLSIKSLNMLEETVIQHVIEYLDECSTYEYNGLDTILDAVYCNPIDRKRWCNSLCTTISNYEKQIQFMYDISVDNILTASIGDDVSKDTANS